MPTKKKSASTKKPSVKRRTKLEDDVSPYVSAKNHRETEALLAKLDKPTRKKKAA